MLNLSFFSQTALKVKIQNSTDNTTVRTGKNGRGEKDSERKLIAESHNETSASSVQFCEVAFRNEI